MVTPIIMDGKTYRVRMVYDSMQRAFELRSGPNADYMLSGRYEPDLLGTAYTYTMKVEPDPQYPDDYDSFYDAISSPSGAHTITVPYGQTTLTYEALVKSGEDTWAGKMAGKNRWHGLSVTYKPLRLQKGADQ